MKLYLGIFGCIWLYLGIFGGIWVKIHVAISIRMRSVQDEQRLYEYGNPSVGIIAWQDLILATCLPLYYIIMQAERPISLRFLNVLTSLNDFIIKIIVFLFLVKYIASGTCYVISLWDTSTRPGIFELPSQFFKFLF